MSSMLTRRLDRLEKASTGMGDLAAQLDAARDRIRAMTPEELHASRVAQLDRMRQQHAIRPLHGIGLAILCGLERVAAHRGATA